MKSDYLQTLFGLDGQTAVVIGGTGVLGGALSLGLAQAGAFVVVAGGDAERGNACVAAIERAGPLQPSRRRMSLAASRSKSC